MSAQDKAPVGLLCDVSDRLHSVDALLGVCWSAHESGAPPDGAEMCLVIDLVRRQLNEAHAWIEKAVDDLRDKAGAA